MEDLAEGRGPDWEEQLPDCDPAYQTVHMDTFDIDGGEIFGAVLFRMRVRMVF